MIYTVFKRKGLIPKIEVINQYFFVVLILKLYNKVASDIILKCCNHKSCVNYSSRNSEFIIILSILYKFNRVTVKVMIL